MWTNKAVSLVNAPVIARQLKIQVNQTASTTTQHHDYVNLITLSSGIHNLSTALTGRRREARIVMIDGHIIDIPSAEHMLIVKNDDQPVAIGRVATALGNANINIANMDADTNEIVGSALMCISTNSVVSQDVIAHLCTLDGITSVIAICS